MAIGAELFAQFGQRPKSIGDYRQELDAQEANALALKANTLSYNNALQAAQDDAAYREAAKGFGSDTTANYNALLKVNPKAAAAYQKSALEGMETQAKIDKTRADTDKSRADTQQTFMKTFESKVALPLKILEGATSPQQVLQMTQQAVQAGLMRLEDAQEHLRDMPSDPQQFQQWRQSDLMRGMAIKDQIELQIKRATESRQTANEMMIPDGKGGFMVNQPLVDAKSRISQAGASSITMGSPVPVQLPDGTTGLVQPANRPGAAPQILTLPGTNKPLSPAKDPNAEKPLTETQGNATTFAARMKDASRVIEQMESQGVSGSDARTMAAGNSYTNFLATPEGQQYRQAQENWVTANLRKESGAAIPKDEMDKDIAKWFPKIGDKPEVRAQKAQARKVAERGMLVQAGPGAKQVDKILQETAPAAKPSGDPVADALKKYGG